MTPRKLPWVRCPKGDRLARVFRDTVGGFAVDAAPVTATPSRAVFAFDTPWDRLDTGGGLGPLAVDWPDRPQLVDARAGERGRDQLLSFSGPLTPDRGRLAQCGCGLFGIRDADLWEAIRAGKATASCTKVRVT